MDNLKDARAYGEVGSILSTLGIFIPHVGILAAIAGVVLEILAVDKIASAVNDREIFKNYLASVIVVFIGSVVAVFAGIVLLFLLFFITPNISIVEKLSISNFNIWKSVLTEMPLRGGILLVLMILFIVLFIAWIFEVIAATFLKKSFDSIAKKLNVSMFSTAALLYLIGAITSIVIVGFLIIFVAGILKIVAYFSIPETATQIPSTQASPS